MYHIMKRGFCLLALTLLAAGQVAVAEDLRIIGEDKAFVATALGREHYHCGR